MLLGVLCEGLLLRAIPILVEATLQFVRQMLGPDGGEGPQATGCLDVSDKTDDDQLAHNQPTLKKWGAQNLRGPNSQEESQ